MSATTTNNRGLDKYPEIPWHVEKYSKAPRLKFEWPGGARVAVLMHTAFEIFSEIQTIPAITHFRNAYSDAPSGGWLPAGTTASYDFSSSIEHDYSGRVGIWRILRLLTKYGIKGTISVTGLCTERFPDAVKEIARQGHEICAHVWAQDIRHSILSPELQLDDIRRSVSALERLTGRRPVGWISPGGNATQYTGQFLAQEKFLWWGDPGKNDDLPYLIEIDGHKMVIIGSRRGKAGINAVELIHRGGQQRELYQRFVDEFNGQYAESEQGPGLIYAVMHADFHTAGLNQVYDDMIQYARRFPGVWFTTREEIARYLLEKYG
ncbi:MAG: polysaccharide deacetylase family protein [Betaproteobacteria bacterium]|nr:polysaccharide deacetylase family protein [Betaproteobacteria bacterium]